MAIANVKWKQSIQSVNRYYTCGKINVTKMSAGNVASPNCTCIIGNNTSKSY